MVKETFTSDYAGEFFDTEKIVKLLDQIADIFKILLK